MERSLVIIPFETIDKLWTRLNMIANPGEYGLGTERGSFADDDDKKAWEEVGKILEEMNREIYRHLYRKHVR